MLHINEDINIFRHIYNFLDKKFTPYDLAAVLGQIHILDIHDNVQVASESHVYQYLPEVFHSVLIEKIYELHRLYFDSIEDYCIFENLESMKNIEQTLFS